MSAEGDVNPKAYPLADAKLTKDILELVHQAQNYVRFSRLAENSKRLFLFVSAAIAQRRERSDENVESRQSRTDQ